MGFLFKISVQKSNNVRLRAEMIIRFALFSNNNITQSRQLFKQLQIEFFGYKNMFKNTKIFSHIRTNLRFVLSFFFSSVERKYVGQDRALKAILVKLKNWNSAYVDKEMTRIIPEIVSKRIVQSTLKDIYNGTEVKYCLENMERILMKDKTEIVEDDYLQIHGYIVAWPELKANELKIKIKDFLSLKIKINQKQVIISIISLKSVDKVDSLRKLWKENTKKAEEVLSGFNPKINKLVIVVTDSNYLVDQISSLEKEEQNLNELWPELKLGYNYDEAFKKIIEFLRKDLAVCLGLESVNCIKFVIGDVLNHECLIDVVQALKIFSKLLDNNK